MRRISIHQLSLIILIFASYVSAFEEPVPKLRGKFNYSSRPTALLSQSPIRNRVPDFTLLESENDEEPTTKSPIELSIGYQFAAVGSGLDVENLAGKPVRQFQVKPETSDKDKDKDAEEEDNSNEENDNNESRLLRFLSRKEPIVVPPPHVEEDDDEPSTTHSFVEPPIGYQFFQVSSKLNEPKQVEDKVEDKESNNDKDKDKEDKKKTESSKVEENSEEEVIEEEDDNSDEKKDEVPEIEFDPNSKPSRLGRAFSNLRQDAPCGYHRLTNGQIFSVQSYNFNFSNYRNNELCSWRFFGHHCVLKTTCPCFDIPPSRDCQEDYLKLTDVYSFFQRFCGYIQPRSAYKSTTNNLNILFRTDGRDTATGFLCYVTCTGPGQTEPTPPSVTCPTATFPTVGTTTISGTGTSTTTSSSITTTSATGEVIIPGVTPS